MAGGEKIVALNVRVTEPQARWLRNVAEAQHSGNLSEAIRQAITEAWMFRRVREEYQYLQEVEKFEFPRDENGMTRAIEFLLRVGASPVRMDERDERWL